MSKKTVRTDKKRQYQGQRFTDDMADADVLAAIDNRLKMFYDETSAVRRQWLVNSAFCRGQQFCVLHRSEDRLIYPQAPPGRKQVTIDMIGPWKEHMIASLTQAMPKPDAMPATTDADDVSASRLANGLLDHYWHDWRFIERFIEIAVNLMDFGNVFGYLNYVEDGSRFVARPVYTPTGEEATDKDGNVFQEKSPIGDISIEIVSPQNVVLPLDGLYLDDKPWIILVFRRPMDYFKEMYSDSGGGDVVPETEENSRNYYTLDRISNSRGDNSGNIRVDYANEVVYFQKPSETNPKGMVVVKAGNVLLSRSKWPYEKLVDRYPIEHFHEKQEPGEFWARSRVERQIPLQRLYNLLWSILAENADDMAHQKMLIPNQAGVDDIYDMPEKIQYNYPFKPEFMELGEMPAYFQNMFGLLESKMRDVQSFHGASAGSSVSGVRSDVHAQNLQDQDLLPLSVADELLKSSFERLYEKVLLIAAEKLTEERVIQFTGKNKQIMYRNFKGSMLGNTRKVRVRMDNLWMRSRGITRQTILQAYQMGGITDSFGQPNSAKLMRLLEFDLPESAFDDVQRQTEIAYLEIDKMLSGKPTTAYQWQDHKMHLDVHQDFMNSTDFMDLIDKAEQGDQQALKIVQLFQQHVGQHTQMYMQALMGLAPAPQQNQQQQSKSQAGKETRPKQTGSQVEK